MINKLRCIIVEDEPLAADILVDYVNQISILHLVGVCSDALFALEVMQKERIDLIFLDIHLPKLKGLDFLKTLNQSPQIILTTAYDQYAIEAYDLNVIDYLLKPIEFSRFVKAINKLKQSNKTLTQTVDNQKERRFSIIKSAGSQVKVFVDEVLYIESKKENLLIITHDRMIQTKGQMSDVPAMLKGIDLLRIHRSYFVVPSQIQSYNASQVTINGTAITIGRSYKQIVSTYLNKLYGIA